MWRDKSKKQLFLKKADQKGRGDISSDMLPIPLRVFVPQ
jgi:hypothetical protein